MEERGEVSRRTDETDEINKTDGRDGRDAWDVLDAWEARYKGWPRRCAFFLIMSVDGTRRSIGGPAVVWLVLLLLLSLFTRLFGAVTCTAHARNCLDSHLQ